MSPPLADWLGAGFIFGALSFWAGWLTCNFQWRRWLGERDRQSLIASSIAAVNAGQYRRTLTSDDLRRIQGQRNDIDRVWHG